MPTPPKVAMLGSPPHPRGIFTRAIEEGGKLRFTPASAGNIRYDALVDIMLEVHPRIRGEYIKRGIMFGWFRGSPPHPRGILLTYNWSKSIV